jgi:ABC-type glycerol-3-phosphate transport system substrate-binding protein
MIWFRRLVLLVFLGFVFLILPACSPAVPPENSATATLLSEETAVPTAQTAPTSSPTPTLTPEPESTLGVEEQDLNGQVIRFWHPWNGEAEAALDQLISQFNAENEWGIRVDATAFKDLDALWLEVEAARQAGQAPEFTTGSLHQILTLDRQEPVVDLSEYIDDPIWGLSGAEIADFFPVFWEADFSQERRVGFPAFRSGHLLYYNQARAEELGFSGPPNTPQEFQEQVCADAEAFLNDEDPANDRKGGWIISTHYASTLGWLKAFGAPVVAKSGEGYDFNQPQTREALEFMRGLYDLGCSWLPESDFVENELAAGDGLAATGSVTGIPYQVEAFARQGNQAQWRVIPFPTSDEQAVFPVFGTSFVLLPSRPEAQLASWLFLQWFSQPDQQARWVSANGSLPLQKSTVEKMQDYRQSHPQWSQAVDLVDKAITEPPFASWGQVRWALHDVTTQLYRSYFNAEGIPETVKFLQETASDLHKMAGKDQ